MDIFHQRSYQISYRKLFNVELETEITVKNQINRASWMKGIRHSNLSGTVNLGTIYIDLQIKLVLGKLRPDKLRDPADERYPSLDSSPLSLRGEKFSVVNL